MVGLCLVLVLALTLPVLGGCDSGSGPMVKIGISQIVTNPDLDDVRRGVIDGMAEEGYVEGKNVEYDSQNSEGDMALVTSVAEKFVSDQVDAIVSIATPDSQASVKAAKGTGIPVVFSAVTDPVGAGLLVDWDSHADEFVTGVSDMIVVWDNLDVIAEIVPNLRTLGTVYNPAESNSVYLNEKLLEACSALGIEVVEATVATKADVPAAAQSLVGKVDAIWIGTDNTVVSNREALIKVCEDNSIPFFPSDLPTVKLGGVAAYGFDYYDLGVQTGKMLALVLKSGKANQVPVEKGMKISLAINTAAAERMGVTIPASIIDMAATRYDK
jgi:putative ABC transport system substrate-binding protein